MEEWKTYKLGNLVRRKIGYGIVQPGESVLVGVPIVKVNNIIVQTCNVDLLDKTSKDNSAKYSRTVLNGGELLITVVGSPGKCMIVPSSFKGANIVRAVALIDIRDSLTTKWVYYYLLTPEAQRYMELRLNTTVQATLNIKDLVEMPVPIPSRKLQAKIVSILSSLDSKIELNRRINDNLEQQAQALFKSWFVDFEPFRDGKFVDSELGLIPEGWRILVFKDFIEPSKEKVPVDIIPEYSVTNNGIIPREAKFNKKLSKSTSMNKVLRKDNLVFGMSREILNWGIMEDEIGGVSSAYNIYILNQQLVNPIYLNLYMKARISDFNSLIGTAAREGQSLDKGKLMQMQIYIPTENALQDFLKIYFPIIAARQDLEAQIEKLESIRDTLLPKLMSGELKISE